MYQYETEDEIIEAFNEMLDEVYGDIKIGNLSYSTSQVLLLIDKVAYREALLNYVDQLRQDELISEELADSI